MFPERPHLPPELVRLVALDADPKTASRVRQACHILHSLITTNDLFCIKVHHLAAYPDAHFRAIASNWPGFGQLRITVNGCLTSADIYGAEATSVSWKDTHRDWVQEAVELLLSRGIMPCSTALHAASARGHLGILQRLLECQIDRLDLSSQIDSLQMAVASGQLDAAMALLRAGADVHAFDEMALRIACAKGYSDIIHELLGAGANMMQATFLAARAGHETPLQLAASAGHLRAVRTIICSGVNVASDPKALRLAAQKGHRKLVRLLIDCGGKANGRTLLCAVKGGHGSIVSDLLDAGVNLDFDFGAAIRVAAGMGSLEVVKTLIFRGAPANPLAMSKALREAAFGGHAHVVSLLLEHGANPSAQKHSALVAAASQGHADVVSQIMSAGVDVSECGYAVLLAAIQRGHFSVIRTLRHLGVDPLARRGKLLQGAAETGDIGVMIELLTWASALTADISLYQCLIISLAGLSNSSITPINVVEW